MNHPNLVRLLRLIEFSDSALPVGSFSFSNGLETAAEQGIVRDAASLEEYAACMAVQAALCDGVAALCAHRALASGDRKRLFEADRRVVLCKAGEEIRLMTCRMGRKLTELGQRILPGGLPAEWADAVREERTEGSYPAALAVLFHACGLDEASLFAAHHYGVVNMILNAALRCIRVSHYDTQAILYRLNDRCDTLYEEAAEMGLDDMCYFAPEADILAALHEKGVSRMFMN